MEAKEGNTMEKMIVAMMLGVLTAMTAPAELIENGNFAKGAAHWDLAVPTVYGPPPVAKIKNNSLELSEMGGAVMGYLTLNQAVNIQSNKPYKIRFEAMSDQAGKFLVALHDPGKGSHASRIFETEKAWKIYEFEFVGAYETDDRWVRKWINATRGSKLDGGQTVGSSLHEVENPEGSGPERSFLTVGLGELRGLFAIRNISIVETVPGRP
jgi:hypothetical protein